MAVREEKYHEYPVFKGLQRPLEVMGFRGRYIYWAGGTAAGTILGFLLTYVIAGFLPALILSVTVLGVGSLFIIIKQKKGLYSKKENKGIYVFYRSREMM